MGKMNQFFQDHFEADPLREGIYHAKTNSDRERCSVASKVKYPEATTGSDDRGPELRGQYPKSD
jgi:hypothetical protein